MSKKPYITGLAISAALVLVGCGGGSGGGNAAPSGSTLQGAAVDDLIVGGLVKAVRADTNASLGTTKTDKEGRYSIKVDYKGPVVVEITCDENTTFKDDANKTTKCLDEYKNRSFALHTPVNVAGGTIDAPVTPLTEVVYQKFKESAENTDSTALKEAIEKANNDVALVFAVDPMTDPIKDPTYKAFITAINQAAADQNTTVLDISHTIAKDLEDNNLGSVNDPKLSALANAMQENNLTSNFSNKYNFCTKNPNSDICTIPENAPSADNVQAVKDFVAELRDQGHDISKYLESEANNIGQAIDSSALDVQIVADASAQMGDLVLQAYEFNESSIDTFITIPLPGKDGTIVNVHIRLKMAKTSEDTWSYTFDDGFASGTMTLPPLPEGIEHTFTKLEASIDGTMPLGFDFIQKVPTTQSVSGKILLTKTSAGAKISITGLKVESDNGKKDYLSVDSLKGEVAYHKDNKTDETVFDYVKLDSVTLKAKAGDYEAQGTLSIPNYVKNEHLPDQGTGDTIYTMFEGEIGCAQGDVLGGAETVELDMNGTAYDPRYIVHNYNIGFGFVLTGKYGEDVLKKSLEYQLTCNDANDHGKLKSYNVYYDDEETLTNSGWVPKVVKFDGDIKNTATEASLNGKVTVDILNAKTIPLTDLTNIGDDTIEALELKVDMDVTHSAPQRPDTKLNLHYKTTVKEGHTLTGSFSHDATIISFDGKMNRPLKDGKIDFSAPNGIKANFEFKDSYIVSGDISKESGSLIKKDGEPVAAIVERINHDAIFIKYADGYVESIF